MLHSRLEWNLPIVPLKDAINIVSYIKVANRNVNVDSQV